MYWIDTSDSGRLMSSDRQIPFWADSERDVPNLQGWELKEFSRVMILHHVVP